MTTGQTTGDPMYECPMCHSWVYLFGWHDCRPVIAPVSAVPLNLGGWICPRCGGVWAYWVAKCTCVAPVSSDDLPRVMPPNSETTIQARIDYQGKGEPHFLPEDVP